MRFADFNKKTTTPVKDKMLSYQELLEKRLKESLENKKSSFTAMQLAVMEGGHSL